MSIPNLAGVATSDLVESIGSNKFAAQFINWSRTMHLLRVHAPGWLPELVQNEHDQILHRAPEGAYLLIRFSNLETGHRTPAVPQAVMDTRNASIPWEKITSRDITDTHRRGVCMAAALTFGLAYELWAKMPLESGYVHEEPAAPANVTAEQANQLLDLAKETESDIANILKWAKVEKAIDMPVATWEAAMKKLRVKKEAKT